MNWYLVTMMDKSQCLIQAKTKGAAFDQVKAAVSGTIKSVELTSAPPDEDDDEEGEN